MTSKRLASAMLAAAFALPIFGFSAHAQTTNPGTVTPGTSAPSPGAAGTGLMTHLQPGQERASRIIGASVYDANNNSIGSINDLVVSPQQSRIDAAVLSVGGFLGIGDKLVAVPLSEVRQGQNNRIVVNMTREQLQSAPSFQYEAPGGTVSGSSGTGMGTGTGAGTGTGTTR